MEEYIQILNKCALFQTIKIKDYKPLLACVNYHIKSFKPDEYIFLSGDIVSYVGIVLKGSLEIIKENPAGGKHIVDFLAPCDVFAEGIVCTSNRISPVTVKAKENCELLFIPFERILHTCSNACSFHTLLIRNMMLLLGEKNYILNRKIELLNIKGMREKLAAYLLYEHKKNKAMTFQIVPNRTELAEYLNVSRTSMCRELARMKSEGILDYYLNSFQIVSLQKLLSCMET